MDKKRKKVEIEISKEIANQMDELVTKMYVMGYIIGKRQVSEDKAIDFLYNNFLKEMGVNIEFIKKVFEREKRNVEENS